MSHLQNYQLRQELKFQQMKSDVNLIIFRVNLISNLF